MVLKLGAKGSLAAGDGAPIEYGRPYKVKVIDTTAAGDAFTAALAIRGPSNSTGTTPLSSPTLPALLTTTAFGAQPALPTREAVDRLVQRATRG